MVQMLPSYLILSKVLVSSAMRFMIGTTTTTDLCNNFTQFFFSIAFNAINTMRNAQCVCAGWASQNKNKQQNEREKKCRKYFPTNILTFFSLCYFLGKGWWCPFERVEDVFIAGYALWSKSTKNCTKIGTKNSVSSWWNGFILFKTMSPSTAATCQRFQKNSDTPFTH